MLGSVVCLPLLPLLPWFPRGQDAPWDHQRGSRRDEGSSVQEDLAAAIRGEQKHSSDAPWFPPLPGSTEHYAKFLGMYFHVHPLQLVKKVLGPVVHKDAHKRVLGTVVFPACPPCTRGCWKEGGCHTWPPPCSQQFCLPPALGLAGKLPWSRREEPALWQAAD